MFLSTGACWAPSTELSASCQAPQRRSVMHNNSILLVLSDKRTLQPISHREGCLVTLSGWWVWYEHPDRKGYPSIHVFKPNLFLHAFFRTPWLPGMTVTHTESSPLLGCRAECSSAGHTCCFGEGRRAAPVASLALSRWCVGAWYHLDRKGSSATHTVERRGAGLFSLMIEAKLNRAGQEARTAVFTVPDYL